MGLLGGTEHLHEGPWPECLGISGNECEHLIASHAPDVVGHVVILPEDSMVTMDFSPTRVRIFVDGDNLVTRTPRRG
jgi:Potato inhibitor I family